MPGFVQIMEIKTSRIDEVEALIQEFRDGSAVHQPVHGMVTEDRDRPGTYVNIIRFDSYEEAMKNSNDPVTTAFAEKMGALLDGPPKFLNLDVRQEI